MRLVFLALIFFILCGNSLYAFDSTQSVIEINLPEKEVRLSDLCFGDFKINGEFNFAIDKDDGSLTIKAKGKDIVFKDKIIAWVEADLVKKGNIIFIERLNLPNFDAKGIYNLVKDELILDIVGNWPAKSKNLEGLINIKVKARGSLNNFLISGYLTMKEGRYKGRDLSYLRLDFFGKPPIFNITNSEVKLLDGTIVQVEGILDLRAFSSFIPNAELIPQRVYIDKWELFSEKGKGIGLKKQIDDRIDVSLGTNTAEGEQTSSRTGVSYNLKDDKYLKLDMEEKQTIFKLERRKEF